MLLFGCDFSSAPTRRKPIVLALGGAIGGERVRLTRPAALFHARRLGRVAARCAAAWVGGFDFPFSLPRELVEHLGWPTSGAAAWRTTPA
jgi:hypothetical protein